MKTTEVQTYNDAPLPTDKLLATVEISPGTFALRQLTLANTRLTGPPGRDAVAKGPRLPFNGDTSGQPTWQRPTRNGSQPCYQLSAFATATRYQAVRFSVDTSGNYTILATPSEWEIYLFVYSDSFDPNNQFSGFPLADESETEHGQADVTRALIAGLPYVAVITGYENTDSGPFALDITGPGLATLEGTGQLFYASPLPYAAALEVDMLGDAFGMVVLSGDVEFSLVNARSGLVREIFVRADGTTRNLTFPSGWQWLGTIPATLAAVSLGHLRLACFGSAEGDVVAQWTA